MASPPLLDVRTTRVPFPRGEGSVCFSETMNRSIRSTAADDALSTSSKTTSEWPQLRPMCWVRSARKWKLSVFSAKCRGTEKVWRFSGSGKCSRMSDEVNVLPPPSQPVRARTLTDRGSVGAHEAGHGLQDLGAREDFQAYAYA